MRTELAAHADFREIRYAQCWEDADILLDGLDIQPGDVCLAIASAGDNALAMLARQPERVFAIDLNPAQLACLELRVAAYREISHEELLILMGSAPGGDRVALYERCRGRLAESAREFWDAHPAAIQNGIGGAGKLERYFALFRKRVLPLMHSQRCVTQLLRGGTLDERRRFYHDKWNTWRWRLLFRVFFSRFVMGQMGRDPSFFRYVEGSVAERVMERAGHALTALNPAENPYLQWILTGRHFAALPFALRADNFEIIRQNLDHLEIHCQSIEEFVSSVGCDSIDRFNLSDVFEYMSVQNYHALLERLVVAGRSKGRLAYWNTFAERRRPESMASRLRSLDDIAHRLHGQDKAFFYSGFVIEEIV